MPGWPAPSPARPLILGPSPPPAATAARTRSRRRPRRHPAGGPDRIAPADEGAAGAGLRLRVGDRRQRPVQLRHLGRGAGPRDARTCWAPIPPTWCSRPRTRRHFQADSPPGRVCWSGPAPGRRALLPASAGAGDLRRARRVPLRARRLPRRDRRAGPRRRPVRGHGHRERSLIQLFRALRQAADPKATIEMGVATAAQATGAAGAMLSAPSTAGEAGEAIAQFGVPDRRAAALARQAIATAAGALGGRDGRRLLALPGELRRAGRRGPDAVAAGGPARLAGRRPVPAARADRPARRRDRPGGRAGGAVAPQPDRRARPGCSTGAASRRGSRTWSRRRATGSGGALVYVDLDNFKQINDRHGHAQGDAALRAAAELLRRVGARRRSGGAAGRRRIRRLDGERRCAPKCCAAGGSWRRRPRRCSASRRMPIRRSGFPSASRCCGPASAMIAMRDLIALADRAMYQVKHGAKGGVALLEE